MPVSSKFVRLCWPPVALVLILASIYAAGYAIGSPVLLRSVTEMLVRVVAVVALYIFVGNSGILSFGHVAFMSIGAYASAWQTY
jgi:branched-chain amino acid transport system permease protein